MSAANIFDFTFETIDTQSSFVQRSAKVNQFAAGNKHLTFLEAGLLDPKLPDESELDSELDSESRFDVFPPLLLLLLMLVWLVTLISSTSFVVFACLLNAFSIVFTGSAFLLRFAGALRGFFVVGFVFAGGAPSPQLS